MKTNQEIKESELQSRPEQVSTTQGQIGLNLVKPFKFAASPCEYKVVPLRVCPTPDEMQICDTPARAAYYWQLHNDNPYFNPECECLVVLLLNTRRRVKAHQLLSLGTQDTLLVHPREVFRLAVITSASAIIVMHNHPSGEATPSEADIKVTRDLIRAGQLMKIEVLDHVIIGRPNFCSLREVGYFLFLNAVPNMKSNSQENWFGPLVFSYTRAQALADGMQIDVSSVAAEAGIRFPVFLTRSVFEAYIAVPPGIAGQDEAGRLWDIVWMLRVAILQSKPGTARLPVTLYVRNDNRKAQRVSLIATCGAFDIADPRPAITVMMPNDD